MDKHVLAASIRSDETIAPLGAEPFHRAGLLDGWPVRCRRLGTQPSRCHWNSGTAVGAQHPGDVWPLMAGADLHFEGFARLNSGDPALGQQASMQERIARSV